MVITSTVVRPSTSSGPGPNMRGRQGDNYLGVFFIEWKSFCATWVEQFILITLLRVSVIRAEFCNGPVFGNFGVLDDLLEKDVDANDGDQTTAVEDLEGCEQREYGTGARPI